MYKRPNYHFQNVLVRTCMGLLDKLIHLLFSKQKRGIPISPNRILICNLSHLGDVVIVTGFIRFVKVRFPRAKIGFLSGSWSSMVVKGHPDVDWSVSFDHWKLNRSRSSFFSKLLRHFRSKKQAVQQLRELCFDMAIDTHYHFPNSARLLRSADIPVRLGVDSGGCGALYTEVHHYVPTNQPVIKHLTDAFSEMIGCVPPSKPLIPNLVSVPVTLRQPYIVFQVGTGDPKKLWELENWKTLLDRVIALQKYHVVFTGYGTKEEEAIDAIVLGDESTTNLCSKLSWAEFVGVIQGAQGLISVDTVAGHVASAFNTPTISLYTGMAPTQIMMPTHEKLRLLTPQDRYNGDDVFKVFLEFMDR